MKIQYASDLHLEFKSNREYLAKHPLEPIGDILILAGDICYLTETHFELEFFDYVSSHWKQTYITSGRYTDT